MPGARPTNTCPYLTAKQVARYLGMATSSFYRKRAALEAAGFPGRDPLVGLWDRDAIDEWRARRRHSSATADAGQQWLDALDQAYPAAE